MEVGGEKVYFGFLYVGNAEPLGMGQASVIIKEPKYLLVVIEDISPYIWLKSAAV